MKLFDVLKGKGYNPYRGAGGRFASGAGGAGGGKAKKPSVKDIDDSTWQAFAGASRFPDGSKPLIAEGMARGFGPKGWEVRTATIASAEGVQVHLFDDKDGYLEDGMQAYSKPQWNREEDSFAGGGMTRQEAQSIMRSLPRNWTPALLKKHGLRRIL